MSKGSGLIRTLKLAKECNIGVRSYYCQLISLLGKYDITPGEGSLNLFNYLILFQKF